MASTSAMPAVGNVTGKGVNIRRMSASSQRALIARSCGNYIAARQVRGQARHQCLSLRRDQHMGDLLSPSFVNLHCAPC